MDFISYLFDKEQDERIYNQWLHTSMQQSFEDFKKSAGYQSQREEKTTQVTKEEADKMLEFATQFVKPKTESGVT